MSHERRINTEWPKDVPQYAWRRFEDQPIEWQRQMMYLRGRLDGHDAAMQTARKIFDKLRVYVRSL